MNEIRILVVDPTSQDRHFLKRTLERHGFMISTAENRHDALDLVSHWHPDLMLLDLELPTKDDGLQVILHVRTWSHLPIIALSAHDREEDTVAALTSGADDYVTKPFRTAELLARIQVALRHAAQVPSGHENALTIGDLSIDLVARRVMQRGQTLHLTPTEYSILRALVLQQGRVVPYRDLLRNVWGQRIPNDVTKLRVFINQLRHKIEDDPAKPRYVVTETGVGYRFDKD